MDERGLIERIARSFPRAPGQRSALFECDAEIVPFAGALLAATVDEFSEVEDGFGDGDPALLGWNLAVATVSDLLAAGATPSFFLHAVIAPEGDDGRFVGALSEGVAEALAASGCHLLGGDLGRAPAWRYTGVALGACPGEPVRRVTRRDELLLYATGDFGDGNLAALDRRRPPRFESRRAFSARIAGLSRLAMDSSDGLRETLLSLARLNPGHRIVATADAPLNPAAREAARASGLPAEAFLVGSAGEYELLVGVDPADRAAFEAAAEGEAALLGRLERSSPAGAGLFWEGGRLRAPRRDDVTLPDPRETPREAYIRAVVEAAGRLFY